MADFSGNGYGIAGSKNTTPNYPPPVRTTTVPTIAQQMEERRRKYGSANVGGSYISPSGTGTLGTPMRPVAPRPVAPTGPIPYFGGTPTSVTGYSPRPTYFGGTPTSTVGYNKPVDTGPFALGYTPDPARDYSEEDPVGRMREIQRQKEEARKKAEQEAEAARNAELERTFSELPALLPEQQQAYRQAVRDAQREFELMRNQVQLGRSGARRDFRQGVRSVNREQTGQSTDLAEALAFLGMDTSPATMGVGLQDIEREADLARAELARVRAMTMGDLDAQMTQARIGRNRQLSAAEQARLAARAQRATDLERYRMELFGR